MDFVSYCQSLRDPRFRCTDTTGERSEVFPLEFLFGDPATPDDLAVLRGLSGDAYAALEPVYRAFNGFAFHVSGDTAGLASPTIDELRELNLEWRNWFRHVPEQEMHAFQRDGLAFATIVSSGNYFIVHEGRVYYSNHDGGDDVVWADSVEALLERALREPVKFLLDAGCYTRYFDGLSEDQFIPDEFLHD